jgi:hypothetical protein
MLLWGAGPPDKKCLTGSAENTLKVAGNRTAPANFIENSDRGF